VDEPLLLKVHQGSLYIPFSPLPELILDKFFAFGQPRQEVPEAPQHALHSQDANYRRN
jgi:hypothetical protein